MTRLSIYIIVHSRIDNIKRCALDVEIFGKICGFIVLLNIVPYSIRVYQDKIKPNIVSWGLWSLIGFSLLVTYDASGAKANIWPAFFGFTNPLMITLLLICKRREIGILEETDKICLFLSLVSLELWFVFRNIRELAQFALYLSIVADAIAAIPTFRDIFRNPENDRPVCWGIFGLGYLLSMFSITESFVSNYILPIYMVAGSFSITFILARYRIKNRIPLREWV